MTPEEKAKLQEEIAHKLPNPEAKGFATVIRKADKEKALREQANS